ncbi:OLC1v1012312C1 [Oldenlandia corymbosa var. corymbosa]|uniref:OLC1v1012312C1 n=1 Tax=Oldenlandia corymbosa var. corymbosa TaxID=529605 RepID=A0AAV1DZ63_OLDCO|nr:OLC1v1012312C1 [Oldenlandia corymbosa var. corymbosa]
MESVVVGCRFQPTDEELVSHYLKKMILGLPFTEEEKTFFTAKHLYGDNATPWELLTEDLPWHKVLNSNRDIESQKVIYVFTFLTNVAQKNSKNRKNKNRVAGCGTWNVNSSAKPVRDNCGFGRKIGECKNFTFESAEQTVGQWTMTEYSIDAAANGIPEVEGINCSDYVLCKIKRDDSKSSKGGRIVSRKRKNEIMLPEEAGQSFTKKMKSVSRKEEDMSVLSNEDDDSAAIVMNNEEAGVSSYGSLDCGTAVPWLMNAANSDTLAAAAGPSTCWNCIPDNEAFCFSSNFQSTDLDPWLKELEAF